MKKRMTNNPILPPITDCACRARHVADCPVVDALRKVISQIAGPNRNPSHAPRAQHERNTYEPQ